MLGLAFFAANIISANSDENIPFSNVDPLSLKFMLAERPDVSMPGPALEDVSKTHSTLPTNSWCQNLMIGSGEHDENRVYQLPYIVDVASSITGMRTNPIHVYADSTQVMTQFEANNGITLGASDNEIFQSQHQIIADEGGSICSLFGGIEWKSNSGSAMEGHIARGSPYSSMMYHDTTPLVYAEQVLIEMPTVDGNTILTCGESSGSYSSEPVLVNEYLELKFIASDMTWLVFFSEPTTVECWNAENKFQLRSVEPMVEGMVRVALANNCTTGSNPQYCVQGGIPQEQTEFKNLLIAHADIYPTSGAFVDYSVDVSNGAMEVVFDWQPASMADISTSRTDSLSRNKTDVNGSSSTLLTYALPHHQSLLSSDDVKVLDVGCTVSMHGSACPVEGNTWILEQPLRPVSFDYSNKLPREEMIADINTALATDIKYEVPENYMRGAGDTYFSGKMLAKLARILIAAETMSTDTDSEEFQSALTRLREGTEVWFNGSAAAPFLYDPAWGGLTSCGCNYDEGTDTCTNTYPDCPALSDSGQNFGE